MYFMRSLPTAAADGGTLRAVQAWMDVDADVLDPVGSAPAYTVTFRDLDQGLQSLSIESRVPA